MSIYYAIPRASAFALVSLGAIGIGLAVGAFLAFADDDDDYGRRRGRQLERREIGAAIDPVFKTECSSCHMLYPTGLLPARSWKLMMAGLNNHFGENASLDKETTERLTKFLTENAADRSDLRRSKKIAKSIPQNEAPQRFTETNYFKRQHHEVSAKIWKRKAVGSPANCVACHKGAETGAYAEDDVRIPK